MMRNEATMAMMEKEQSEMGALQKEGQVRAATDAEIQHELERIDARDRLGVTIEAYLEKVARRVFGLDKQAIDKEIQGEVNARHILAEELNTRYDTLRSNVKQAYEEFQQKKKDYNVVPGLHSMNGYFLIDENEKVKKFYMEYKDPEVEAARQRVRQEKKVLEQFVNEELFEDSAKDYDQSKKGVPFEERIMDIDIDSAVE